jgi:HlyD family secretion protein
MGVPQGPSANASPEQIGTLAHITSPLWWVVVVVLMALGTAISVWALVGEIYVTVSGLGVVVPSSGVITLVTANAAGRVAEIKVEPGEQVQAGQVVALLIQERLRDDLEAAKASLKALTDQRQQQVDQNQVALSGQKAATDAQIASLQDKMASLRQTLVFQTKVLSDMEDELKQGFATRTQVEQARSDKINTELTLHDTATQIQTVRTQLAQDKASAEQQIFSLDQQILKARQQVHEAFQTLTHSETVWAPIDGQIATIATSFGKMVAEGDPVMVMEPESTNVRVAAYFQIADGKRIQRGSSVRVKINSIDSDVYGTAVGTVIDVADLPATGASLRNTMENDKLVAEIEQAGAPLKVLVDLDPIKDRPRYVMMSSGKPSPISVTIGTTITAQVIVEKSAPISYVIRLFD